MATIKRFTEIVAWQKGCRLVAEKYAWSVEAKQMKVVYGFCDQGAMWAVNKW